MTVPIDGAAGLPLFEPGMSSVGGVESLTPDNGDLSFTDALGRAVEAHSARAAEASQMAEAFAAGETEDIHGTMIAIKEVEIELHLISNVRRKAVEAFQELWRMNI